jgi:hypothetical protein
MSQGTGKEENSSVSSLATAAADQIRTAEAARPAPAAGDGGRRSNTWLAAAAAAIGLAAATYAIVPRFLATTDASLRADLVQVVESARQEIEKYRSARGELPESIPDPLLASIIQYERSGQGYRLRVKIDTVSVEMDEKGAVR